MEKNITLYFLEKQIAFYNVRAVVTDDNEIHTFALDNSGSGLFKTTYSINDNAWFMLMSLLEKLRSKGAEIVHKPGGANLNNHQGFLGIKVSSMIILIIEGLVQINCLDPLENEFVVSLTF